MGAMAELNLTKGSVGYLILHKVHPLEQVAQLKKSSTKIII